METVPVAVGRFSLVQICLGCVAWAGGAESCDCAWGGGALLSCDCAAADKPAKKVKAIANGSERGTKPPVSQGQGRYSLKPILGGKISWVGGIGSRLFPLGMPAVLLGNGRAFPWAARVAGGCGRRTPLDGESRKKSSALQVEPRKNYDPQPRAQ